MPQDRELLDAVRKDYPELKDVPDAELYSAVVKDFPELAPQKPSPKLKDPSWLDLRFPGMPSINDVLGAGKGAGKALGDFVQTGGQWMENIAGMPVSAPRTTETGRDVFQPNTPQEQIGKTAGQVGLALAGGAAGGPTMAGQVAAGGLMGALQNPDAPAGPAAAGMAAPVAGAAIQKYAPMVKALMGGREAGAEKFNQISSAVKGANVNTDALAQPLVEADLLSRTGSVPPKVIKDLFRWEGPIDYESAGRFANRAGRLTVAESLDTDKAMKATVTKVYDALQKGKRAEAAKVGMGPLYDQAMKEYALGMKGLDMKDALAEALKNHGAKMALGAGIGYGAYRAVKD